MDGDADILSMYFNGILDNDESCSYYLCKYPNIIGTDTFLNNCIFKILESTQMEWKDTGTKLIKMLELSRAKYNWGSLSFLHNVDQ